MTESIPTTVSLRPATAEDLNQVSKIESISHQAPWTYDHLKAELSKPHSCFWVLTDDETDEIICGYIVFWVVEKEARLLNICVPREYRGQGYAKQMLRQAIDHVRRAGASRFTLEVRKSNLGAIALYQNHGFLITRILKGLYSDGEDAYEMEFSVGDETLKL